jgi:hypothetical protein
MLAYNIWRYFKMMAEISNQTTPPQTPDSASQKKLKPD